MLLATSQPEMFHPQEENNQWTTLYWMFTMFTAEPVDPMGDKRVENVISATQEFTI